LRSRRGQPTAGRANGPTTPGLTPTRKWEATHPILGKIASDGDRVRIERGDLQSIFNELMADPEKAYALGIENRYPYAPFGQLGALLGHFNLFPDLRDLSVALDEPEDPRRNAEALARAWARARVRR
jgi:hypothetical protein